MCCAQPPYFYTEGQPDVGTPRIYRLHRLVIELVLEVSRRHVCAVRIVIERVKHLLGEHTEQGIWSRHCVVDAEAIR